MHEGHRKRMYEKLKEGDGLYDHELLEILLFNAYPRKNTNPVAHALLNAFGSLSGVLSADGEQLTAVDGVGENVALYLKCAGECLKRISPSYSGVAVLKSYGDFTEFTKLRLRGKQAETLELYCLEKNGKIISVLTFTDNEVHKVEVETDYLAGMIAKIKPYGILVAHNHLSGNENPSVRDDKFTMELQLICSMNNVCLYDHLIYASDKQIYSYYKTGRMDDIKKNFNFKEVVERQVKNVLGENSDKK